MEQKIQIVDTTLRDGSHAVRHSFTEEQVSAIAAGLDRCNVPLIELSHGDGLGGSSYTYGFSKRNEFLLLKAAAKQIKNGKLTVLLLPGIGTIEDLKKAYDCGAKAVRVATHVTEADVSAQHIEAARRLGMMTVGFLMMTHMAEPQVIAEEAKKMESYGADYINLADSAGFLLPEDVAARVKAVKEAVSIPVGFHAHNNLNLAIANSLAAVEAGARYIDATLRGLGAGAGNTQIEVLAGVLKRKGIDTGLDFYGLMDLAERSVEPLMQRPQTVDNGSLMLGYAGVYSSFLLHVYDAAKKYDLDPRDIMIELGRRRMVGGQEDMILSEAYQLKQQAG
ncbi:4-hydroxy-2-oxovalerate aldolase [Lacrimispora defluvii]|uniref:4-hydroxy-2-oxovalerate aldolase n=1 Tax=Lacrimispora defluvii TaxID=2719233 RepID=A0ABX1VQ53_9FIRM|nr:4-hydroxy-2-oxovalerate aldolase [Lacrimispora defluvii]NNJ29992.1 4-hydroxy-2-oxovalerate aldolase [Lacrimispora defluvii]